MARLEPHDVIFFASASELRAWLDANHRSANELWVGYAPKGSGRPRLTWEQVVDEILCYGWIDSVRMPLDGGAAQRITPRRRGSIWSDRNVGRVEALRAERRMTAAGEEAFARRKQDRTGVYPFEREWELDEAAMAALRTDPAGFAFWEAQPRTYRRGAAYWIMGAKRPDTRSRRLARLVEGCAAGERLVEITGRPRGAG